MEYSLLKTAPDESYSQFPGKLLLDTNIIQYALSKELKTSIDDLFTAIFDREYDLAVSNITIFEAQRSARPEKRAEIKKFLEQCSVFDLDDQVLEESASLGSYYDLPEFKINSNSISIADLFIATTSILTGWTILTADCNDFPRPFFDEIHKEIIPYSKGNRLNFIVLYFLTPDYNVLSEISKKLKY